jgi:hypothetical protein
MALSIWLTPLAYVLLGDKSELGLKVLMLTIGVLVLIDLKSYRVADVEHTRPTTQTD